MTGIDGTNAGTLAYGTSPFYSSNQAYYSDGSWYASAYNGAAGGSGAKIKQPKSCTYKLIDKNEFWNQIFTENKIPYSIAIKLIQFEGKNIPVDIVQMLQRRDLLWDYKYFYDKKPLTKGLKDVRIWLSMRYDDDDNQVRTLAVIPGTSNNVSTSRRIQGQETFKKQIDFIKTVLNKSDAAMDKVKVQELSKLMAEAQENITVGQMKKLIKSDEPSTIKKILVSLGVIR